VSDQQISAQERDSQVTKILIHFFQKMVAEEETSATKALQYTPEYFLAWLNERWPMVDQTALREDLQVSDESITFVDAIVHAANGALTIQPVWPRIVLHDRPWPKHQVKSLHTVMLIEWEDGTLYPASRYLPMMLASGPGLQGHAGCNDALLACQLFSTRDWIQDIIHTSLDVIHDTRAANYGGDHPFDVMMGLMLWIVAANKASRDKTTVDPVAFAKKHNFSPATLGNLAKVVPQIDPKLLDYLEGYVRLCQAMIRPPLPLAARQEIERRRNEIAGNPSKSVRGGWDG
jgi:hypothetical protein